MEWNNQLTALNYFLADMYDTVQESKRLLDHAGIPKIHITFSDQPLVNWHGILSYLRKDDGRLQEFVGFLVKAPNEPTAGNAFLKGILQNLKDQVTSTEGRSAANGWQGDPLTPAAKEKIIGKRSNLLPISFLEVGMDCSKAVARVTIGREAGTGFLIANNWFITNNHVIGSIKKAKLVRLQFNYQLSKTGNILEHENCTLDPGNSLEDRHFFTNETEDWTIVKVNGDLNERYGSLQLSEKGTQKEQFVNIIQHPDGGPKQIALYNNMVMYSDDNIVQYLTDTLPGSSGSPVFDSEWEVVALHFSGGWTKEPGSPAAVYRNIGTNIGRVRKAIQDNNIDLNINSTLL